MIEKTLTPKYSVTYDGATVNIYHANKNEGLPKHMHAYSHLTIVNAGSVLVTKELKKLTIDKNSEPINLIADEWHEIEALEDGTVFINVFSEGKY